MLGVIPGSVETLSDLALLKTVTFEVKNYVSLYFLEIRSIQFR